MPHYYQDIIDHAETWFRDHMQDYIDAVMRLAAIPSISDPFTIQHTEDTSLPFGQACADAVAQACEEGKLLGLEAIRHGGFAAEVYLPAQAKDAEANKPLGDIAFFSHLDVVAADSNWSFDPFSPFEKDGILYGRGVDDNKGPALAVLFSLGYLKASGYAPRHRLVVYLGADEERDMDDMKLLLSEIDLPKISLVSDAYFPVCIAEKGILNFRIRTVLDDSAVIDIHGGEAPNIVPSYAQAIIDGQTSQRRIEASGKAAHTARPDGSFNALGELFAQLKAIEHISSDTQRKFAFLQEITANWTGSAWSIETQDAFEGALTCVAVRASLLQEDDAGKKTLEIAFNLRYPSTVNAANLIHSLESVAQDNGFSLCIDKNSPGYHRDQHDPLVQELTDLVNNRLHENYQPYAMGGATHARLIPGAYGFGPGRFSDSSNSTGRGGPHQPDEQVALKNMFDAFMVYTETLLYLDNRSL